MEKSFNRVKKYYDQFDEWSRLDSAAGVLEKGEVLHLVSKYVPSGAHILDLGSGPGRYAIEFAEMGYTLSLFDLSPRLMDQAREQFRTRELLSTAKGFHVGNATDLSAFATNQFDAIFCCGPFYHIVEEKDRINAAREALRVCKPSGSLLIGFIPKFSGLAGLLYRAANKMGQVDRESFRTAYETGVFHNGSQEGFQEGYYPGVEQTRSFWSDLGLRDIEVCSTRSFMHQNEQHLLTIREQDPELFQTILGVHREVARSDAYIEAGGHALLIGRK